MKVNNKVIDKPNEVLLVLPRSDGDLVFKFTAVTSSEEFDKISPEPIPPKIRKKGGIVEIAINDPDYKAALQEWAGRQTHWQFLKSIAATDGLEWETVNMDDPGTWQNWRKEMSNCGFSIGELNAIWGHFMEANALSQNRIEEARSRFLASEKVKEENLLSQTEELSISSSGELVNDLTSVRQE